MTKREKKIQVVKQMLSSCVNSGTSAFSFGNIPRNRFEGAKKSYAYDAKYDEVLALIDTTVFGGGERGMIITEHDVYLKEILSSPEHCKLSNIGGLTVPGETYYNRNNLCEMLAKLEEIENEPEYGFWDTVGNIVSTVIDEGAKAMQKEYMEQMAEEEEEALEELENLRDLLETLRDSGINDLIQDYDELEAGEEILDKIMQSVMYSCLLANEYDKYKKIRNISDDSEIVEEVKKFMETINSLVEEFDDIYDSDIDEDIEPLSRTFKRFHSSMIRIYGEMLNDEEDKDVIELDLEDYYAQTQKAAKTLKKKINALLSRLNREIEEAYDD